MSKNRNLMVLGAVLVALAAISLLQKVGRERATSRPVDAPILAGFDRDALRRLEISRGDSEPVVLVNGPAGWEVASRFHHPASEDRVRTLLSSLEGLRGEFRSKSADVLPDYGLTDSTAIVIRGYSGGGGGDGAGAGGGDGAGSGAGRGGAPMFAIQVGERPRGGIGNFVRVPGSTVVHLTKAGLLNDLGIYGGLAAPESKHFLALDAFKVERDEVDAIRIYQGPDLKLAMQKEFPAAAAAAVAAPVAADESGSAVTGSGMAATDRLPDRQTYEWRLTAPQQKPAAKTKADAILGALAMIRAADVADPGADSAAYGLAEPERRVVIVTRDGKEQELLFGSEQQERPGESEGYYFRVAGERPIYVIRQYQVDNVFKDPKDVLPQ